MPIEKKYLLAASALALIVLAAYSNTFDSVFQFDDYLYVIDYNRTHSIGSYWPPHGTRYFTYLSFALNYLAGGMDVSGYHAVNVLIHIANGILVFLMAESMMSTPVLSRSGLPRFEVAFLAALLFVAHPVQTEAVTYISQRFASLAAFFYLLSIVMYLRYRVSGGRPTGKLLYAVSLSSAFIAQMTKEISFTLPFVIALLELAFFEGPLRKRMIKAAPFLLAFGVIPYFIFGAAHGSGVGDVIRENQLRDIRVFSAHDYLATQFRVIVTYLRLLALPVNQNLEYDYPVFHSFLAPQVAASFVFIAALFAGAVYMFFRFLRGGNGYLALIAAGTVWFFVTISVESSIVPIKDLIFEHRLYLPAAGAAMAASAAFFYFSGRVFGGKAAKAALIAGVVLFVLPLGAAAYMRNAVWHDEVSLFEDAVSKSPKKERARYNLAWAYHRKGQLDKAAAQYLEDLKLDPGKEKAHYNLALIYQGRGEMDKAVHHLDEALRINPKNAVAYYQLAMAYHQKGDLDKAIDGYEKAVAADRSYQDAYYNLGMAQMEKGRLSDAGVQFSTVLRLDPSSLDALYQLGRVYEMEGNRDKARTAFSEVLRMSPDFNDARTALERVSGGKAR